MNQWLKKIYLNYREVTVAFQWILEGLVSLMTATELPTIEISGMRLDT